MKFSPVLGFYKNKENDQKTISTLKEHCCELEKQIESKNEDIRLLRELVQKQYLEIKKIKSNRSHKTIHLF